MPASRAVQLAGRTGRLVAHGQTLSPTDSAQELDKMLLFHSPASPWAAVEAPRGRCFGGARKNPPERFVQPRDSPRRSAQAARGAQTRLTIRRSMAPASLGDRAPAGIGQSVPGADPRPRRGWAT